MKPAGFLMAWAALLYGALWCDECRAQAVIDQVDPPVVQRGRVNRIRVAGSQVEQVLGLWTSTPGAALSAKPVEAGDGKSVAIDLTVPADAPLGIYGLRLSTRSGLSNPTLFVIDELPVQTRPSAADAGDASKPSAGMPLSLPACVAAPCRKEQVDRYSISVKAGEKVTFEVIGNRLGRDYDPLVTVRDAANRIVAQGDNDVGLFFDCRFEHRFADGGIYFVDVSDARFLGEPHWNYVLRIGDFPVARTAIPSWIAIDEPAMLRLPQSPGVEVGVRLPADLPRGPFWHELRERPGQVATWVPLEAGGGANLIEREPNDSPAEATPAYLPANWNGVLQQAGDEDWYVFELSKGQSIRVRSEAQRFGSAADLELALFQPSNEPFGQEVMRVDETSVRDDARNTSFVTEASFVFTARVEGPHWLQVRDLTGAGGSAFSYRVEVTDNTPELVLKSESSALTIPRKNFQTLPLKVTRTGFTGPIELTLVGAPPGVRLEPTTIPADATEFVGKLIADESAQEGLSTLQVVGRYKDEKVSLEAVAAVHPLVDRQLRNKDRILFALRADQRDLPPSLTNRIAVQVTPPAPFDIELPEQLLMLPKYQTADLPIVTNRQPGFASPISFDVEGGQIGSEAEERVQVYAKIPDATGGMSGVTGTLFNRILTRYEKHRVDLTATAPDEGHFVSLTRTFTLDIKSAFDPKFSSPDIELLPGEKGKVTIAAQRVATFDGPIELESQNPPGVLIVPEKIAIPAGTAEVDWEIQVRPGTNPGRYQVRFESTGYVGKFQELLRNPVLTVTVKKPMDGKK